MHLAAQQKPKIAIQYNIISQKNRGVGFFSVPRAAKHYIKGLKFNQ